jgi:hypothetical protein
MVGLLKLRARPTPGADEKLGSGGINCIYATLWFIYVAQAGIRTGWQQIVTSTGPPPFPVLPIATHRLIDFIGTGERWSPQLALNSAKMISGRSQLGL